MVKKEIKIVSQSKFLAKMTVINLKDWLKSTSKNEIELLVKNSLVFAGHSTIIMDINGKRIITDPVLYNHIGHNRKTSPVTKKTIPKNYDYILITHHHLDHLHLPSLKLLNKDATIIIPTGAKSKLEKIGFTKIIELGPFDQIEEGTIRIDTFPCAHDGRRYYQGPMRDTLSYLITSSSVRLFVCGDTAETSNFDSIDADIAFMPIGCYKPISMEATHCNPYQSYEMYRRMNAKFFVPIHFETLKLALDDELETLSILNSLRENDDRIKILNIGKTIKFNNLTNL